MAITRGIDIGLLAPYCKNILVVQRSLSNELTEGSIDEVSYQEERALLSVSLKDIIQTDMYKFCSITRIPDKKIDFDLSGKILTFPLRGNDLAIDILGTDVLLIFSSTRHYS